MSHVDHGRVVEVRSAVEGSGFLIGPRLVLTAWHVVRPTDGGPPPEVVEVRILRDVLHDRGAAGGAARPRTRHARLIWPRGEPGGDHDFALLELVPDGSDKPENDLIRWAELPAWGEAEVDALGFPDFAISSGERDTHSVRGTVPLGVGLKARRAYGRGTVDIVLRLEVLPEGPALGWEGMSGAAVFSGPNLVGIVRNAGEARSRTQHRLRMLPVQRLFQREDVQEALRSAGLGVPLQAEPGGTIVFKLFEGVPPRDRGFTGREALLAKLHAALTDANLPPAATQVVAVNGPPGVGKTSLAAEYAHRKAPEFAGVWWAPAEGRALLIASLAALALRLEPSLASERDQEKVAQAGLASLAKSPRPLLLVYDNAQTPGALRGLVPPAGARVLVTTRWSDWGGQAKEVYADVLAPDAAVAFLQQRADRTDPMGAARLANELGNLPLALDHAGAYCRRSGLSFDEYRRAIDVHIADAPRGEPDRASVAATFSLAIARAAKEQPEAEALLASMAFLAPDRIPLDLLNVGIVDEKRRADALSVLFEVSLVRHVRLDDGAAAVALHRLVQTAARTRLAACGETKAWINLTTRCLQNSFPATAYHDVETWPTCAVLIPHVLALRDHLRAEPSSAELARLVNAAGRYLHRRGSYFEAEELYKQSIAASEEALGHGHTDVARARNNLGHLYRDTGRFAQAESLYKEAIFIGERTLGRPSPEVAAWLNNLANLYRVLKRFDEAEPLVTEAIDITERAHGRRHREVALLVAHLAALRRDMNRTREAEPLYREAISIGEATLGREHPDVATWLNSLAELYRRNKRFNEAEPLYREAISIGEATLGREHPDVAEWRENLSGLLAVMRDGKDDAPSNALS